MNDNEVLCKIEWTVADVKKSLTEELNREPTEEEIQKCINEICWDLIEEQSISTGWTIINTAASEIKED
jgi:DNA-directed RNA polymerase specialized sigma subunit